MEKQLYLNSFFSASIAVFVPLFIWGNTLSHIPCIFQILEMNNSTNMSETMLSENENRYVIFPTKLRKMHIVGHYKVHFHRFSIHD